MGLIGTIRETLEASTPSPDRGTGTSESAGAYWCDPCAERVPAADVEGEDAPACPECGEAMRFERSPGSTGCAC